MIAAAEYKISLMKPTETRQHANTGLYPNVVTIITILLTMPVSTAQSEDVLTFHEENRAT